MFPFRVTHPDLGACRAEVHGREGPDGLWRAWLVFVPPTLNLILVSGPELTQPSREALVYWAIGLDPLHYQVSLDRALRGEPRWRGRLADEGSAAAE